MWEHDRCAFSTCGSEAFTRKKGKQWTMREQMWLDEEEYVFSLPVSCDACGGSRPRGWVTVYTCVSESGICTEQNSLLCLFFFFPFLLQAQFSVTFFDGLWVERVYPQLLCHIDTEPQPRWDRLQHGSDRYSVLPRWTENSGWISVIIRLVVFLSQTALLSSFLISNLFF